MMQLSVVILNYNVQYFLELCLQSVFAAIKNIDAEVIVVDNNSEDNSCTMVKEKFPEAKLIGNKENIGFAKANNQAVRVAKGNYVCILNPDTIVTENTFEDCLKKAALIPNLGLMGVQLLNGKGQFLPESKRNLPTPIVSLFKIFGNTFSYMAPYYAEHVPKDASGEVSVLVGAFMFCDTKKYRQLNGFDERYFMYGEDIDLSFTFQNNGFVNYYLGENSIIHFKGESSFKNSVYRARFFGAMRLFYNKNFKSSWFSKQAVFIGIQLASLLSVSKKDISEKVFSRILVVTTNMDIQLRIGKSIANISEMISLEEIKRYRDSVENVLCVFDMESVLFADAVRLMKELSDTNVCFRFRPKGQFYILGSDFSAELGTVVPF